MKENNNLIDSNKNDNLSEEQFLYIKKTINNNLKLAIIPCITALLHIVLITIFSNIEVDKLMQFATIFPLSAITICITAKIYFSFVKLSKYLKSKDNQ